MDSLLFCSMNLMCSLLHLVWFRMAASAQCLFDAVPTAMFLDFILRLILHRLLLKFLLLLRRKLGAGVLPTAIVVA